jgi:phosphoglycerate dehydrogenase-like enzyme
MPTDILCLRPESDFTRVGVAIPTGPSIAFRASDASDVPDLMKEARVLLIPAVGPKLAPALFEPAKALKLVQITGAGVDRLDQPTLTRLGIPVCNPAAATVRSRSMRSAMHSHCCAASAGPMPR